MNKKIKEKQNIKKIKNGAGIKKLLENGNYFLANKAMIEYLKIYPKDDKMRFSHIKLLRRLGCYEDAKEEMKNISNPKILEHIYLEDFLITIKEGNFKNAIDHIKRISNLKILERIYFEDLLINTKKTNLSETINMETFCKIPKEKKVYYYSGIQFLKNILLDAKTGTQKYYHAQITSYDRNRALKFIHNANDQGIINFNSDININSLFEIIEQSIPNSVTNYGDEVMDIYIFEHPDMNSDEKKYLKIIVLPSSSNIISIEEITNISENIPINKLPKSYSYETGKVKILTQVEKFNKKYNMYS